MAPEIGAEETDYGVRIFSTRRTEKDRTFFRVTNFIIPNKATIPGPMSGDGYNLYWHVPIDDTHHWRYDIVFRRSAPMEEKDIERNQEILDELGPDYHPMRKKSNRYLQDRESMKTWSFSGMGRIFNVQDTAIVEGSGPIVDRTKEFLGPSDKAIIAARRMVLRAIREVSRRRRAAPCRPYHGSKPLSASDGGFGSDLKRYGLAEPLEKQTRRVALTNRNCIGTKSCAPGLRASNLRL